MHKLLIGLFLLLFLNTGDLFGGNNKKNDRGPTKDFINNKFMKWSMKKKYIYVRSLGKRYKFRFIKIFLEGRDFYIPPHNSIKFYNNGKAVVYVLGYRGKDFILSDWEVKGNKLFMHIKKNKEMIDLKRNKNIWDNFKVSATLGKNPSLGFEFFNNKNPKDTFLFFYEEGGVELGEQDLYKRYEEYLKRNKVEKVSPEKKKNDIKK